jgi:HAD superfamily phosphatase (TIGR01668 family)
VWLRPQLAFPTVAEATHALLERPGLKGVLLDVDNTIVNYGTMQATPEAVLAIAALRERYAVALISNNRPHKVKTLAAELDLPFVADACKPFPWRIRQLLRSIDVAPNEAAMVGDQIFTDILGANRAGVLSVLTNPLTEKDFPATRIIRATEKMVLRLMGFQRPALADPTEGQPS